MKNKQWRTFILAYFKTARNFSDALNISYPTALRYLKHPDAISVGDVKRLAKRMGMKDNALSKVIFNTINDEEGA
jgi:hypothetical protein